MGTYFDTTTKSLTNMKYGQIFGTLTLILAYYSTYGQLESRYHSTPGGELVDMSVYPPKKVKTIHDGLGWNAISSHLGKFLFYTDGSKFFNFEGLKIGEMGLENTYTDGPVISIPIPGQPNGYYTFFTAFLENSPLDSSHLYYTTLDLTNEENIAISRDVLSGLDFAGNPLALTFGENCNTYWLITTINDFVITFYIDENGIEQIGKSQIGGYTYCGPSSNTCFKFSPNGKYGAVMVHDFNLVYLELLSFDKKLGTFNSLFKLPLYEYQKAQYALEFSPNSKNLFLLTDSIFVNEDFQGFSNKELWGFKVENQDLESFIQSKFKVAELGGFPYTESSMQIAPTGKIFLTLNNSLHKLSSINNPNADQLEDVQFLLEVPANYQNIYLSYYPSCYFQNANDDLTFIPLDAGPDKTACRDEDISLGSIPISGYTYSWTPGENLNSSIAANPVLYAPNDTLSQFQSTLFTLTARDSLCQFGIDSVKVNYKPSFQRTILGSRSVCPGVDEVSYWVEDPGESTFNWSVLGGSIANSYGDSITVNWGPSNLNAEVNLTAINEFGCPDFNEPFGVKVFRELETEKPRGLDTLLCDNQLYNYSITPTNGSTYNWEAINGDILQGNGSSKITVEWDANYEYGKLWINEFVNTDLETCFGTSDTLEVVNPIAFGGDHLVLNSISATNIDSELIFDYLVEPVQFFENVSIGYFNSNQERFFLSYIDLSQEDLSLNVPLNLSYEHLFFLRADNICGGTVQSSLNSNIALQVTDSSSFKVDWNQPFGWGEITEYSLFSIIDEADPILISTTQTGNILEAQIDPKLGFMFKAHIIAYNTDKNFVARSNSVIMDFSHTPFIPNVITPNGDGFNDFFQIGDIELFSENRLVILNRYGKVVYEGRNYTNNWSADDLPAGTYYYEFKSHNKTLKGTLQVIR